MLTPTLLAPPGRGERRWKPAKLRGGDLSSLIQQVVRLGVQSLPEGTLYDRVVGAVERELIEQVLAHCDDVQVTAAKRLGINRNTLHKKVSDYQRLDGGRDHLTAGD
jgi:DNA-binding protein Fis